MGIKALEPFRDNTTFASIGWPPITRSASGHQPRAWCWLPFTQINGRHHPAHLPKTRAKSVAEGQAAVVIFIIFAIGSTSHLESGPAA
jgi:hypothetical protein